MLQPYTKLLLIAAYIPSFLGVAPASQAQPIRLAQSNMQAMVPGSLMTAILPAKMVLNYHWNGYSPTSTSNQDSLVLQADKKHYHNLGAHQQITHDGQGGQKSKLTKIDKLVTIAEVKKLFVTLEQADWKPAQKPVTVIARTDDSPSFSIEFSLEDKSKVRLFSGSNTSNHAPWNLQVGKQLFVSKSGNIGSAVDALLKAVS